MLLTELLTKERVRVPLESATKEELLRELVDLLVRSAGIEEGEEVLRAVVERESVLSTGIGHGVAIPHGKTAAVPELCLVAGSTRDPVDFDALDGEPVSLYFLLVGPETAAGPHIKALSRISRLVRKDAIRDRLVAARSADEFLSALRDAEGA